MTARAGGGGKYDVHVGRADCVIDASMHSSPALSRSEF